MGVVCGGSDWVCDECGEMKVVMEECYNCKDLEVLNGE